MVKWTKWDRARIPRPYTIQYLKGRGEFPETFVEAVIYFLDGHTAKEAIERCDADIDVETLKREAKNTRVSYNKNRRKI